jgi:hypothetical protein
VLFAVHQPLPRVWSTEAEVDLQDRLSKLPFYAPAGFGGVAEDIQTILAKGPELLTKAVAILNQAGPHLDTVMGIVKDPALPQLVARLKTLKALEAAKAPKIAAAPGAAPAPASTDTGIKKLIPAIDAGIFLAKHPAAQFALDHPVLVGAGALLVITGIGFGIGRLTKRCRVPSAGVGRHYRRR